MTESPADPAPEQTTGPAAAHAADPARDPAPGSGPEHRHYTDQPPSAQLAVDLFAGEWASSFPPSVPVTAGAVPLFQDPRLDWWVEQMGGVAGARVLELGPLEGGHTWMLTQAGASVVAVESHARAYLRCLVARELLGGTGSRFVYGDFLGHLAALRARGARVDAVLMSGVLYHMTNPVQLLVQAAAVTDVLLCWTHYLDLDAIAANPVVQDWHFPDEPAQVAYDGHAAAGRRYAYGRATDDPGFCGGPNEHPVWLPRAQIERLLADLGMPIVATAFDEPQHPNGPAFAFVARRS